MPRLSAIWTRLIRLIKKMIGADSDQYERSSAMYNGNKLREARDDVVDAEADSPAAQVIVNHERAEQAEIGRQLRNYYDAFATEDLPRDILETLSDLNQRLDRRDGE